jgi:hypothetical protein
VLVAVYRGQRQRLRGQREHGQKDE